MRRIAWLILFLIVLGIIGAGAYFYGSLAIKSWQNKPDENIATESAQLQNTDISVLVIDFGDRTGPITSLVSYQSGETALQLLQRVANKEGYDVSVLSNGTNQTVTSIKDQKNSAQKTWKYTVNGVELKTPPNKYELVSGDKVNWAYR